MISSERRIEGTPVLWSEITSGGANVAILVGDQSAVLEFTLDDLRHLMECWYRVGEFENTAVVDLIRPTQLGIELLRELLRAEGSGPT